MCPNFGTSKNSLHLEQMENLLLLGVPILKHITVIFIVSFWWSKDFVYIMVPSGVDRLPTKCLVFVNKVRGIFLVQRLV